MNGGLENFDLEILDRQEGYILTTNRPMCLIDPSKGFIFFGLIDNHVLMVDGDSKIWL